MLICLFLQADSALLLLDEYGDLIDVNTASRQEISSVPLLSDSEVDSIIAHRPFKSLDEVFRLLGLSRMEGKVLSRYIYVSSSKDSAGRNPWRLSLVGTGWVDTAGRSAVRYSLSISSDGVGLSLRGRGDTLRWIARLKGLSAGNFRISYSAGLLGSSYLRSTSGMSIRSHDNLALLLEYGPITAYGDSGKNFLIFTGNRHWKAGIVGRDRIHLYGRFRAGAVEGEAVGRTRLEGYALALSLDRGGIYTRLAYRRVLSPVWEWADTGRDFRIHVGMRAGPLSLRGAFFGSYYYNIVSWALTPSAGLRVRVSRSSARFSFYNSEPFEISWSHGECGDVLSIFYRFFRAIYYSTDCSMYAYGAYVPLRPSGMYVKGQGFTYAVRFSYRGFRFRYMDGELSISWGTTLTY